MKVENDKQKVTATRRTPRQFSDAESSVLLQVYEEDPFPLMAVRQHLADRLKLSPCQIEKWFCKQRNKNHIEGRYRTVSQLAVLDQAFDCDPFPTAKRIHKLATQLNLETGTVCNWFNKRRHRQQKAGEPNEQINLRQRNTLSKFFARNQFPTIEDTEKVAADLHLTPNTVAWVRRWLDTCRRRQKPQARQLHQNFEMKWSKQLRFSSFQLKILNEEVRVRLKNGNFGKQTIMKRNAELSKRLGLPLQQMSSWIRRRRCNNQPCFPTGARLSSEQSAVLREEFAKSVHLTKEWFWEVFSPLGLSHLQVRRWFKETRSRLKRKCASLEQLKNRETEAEVPRSNQIGETSKAVTS